MNDHTIENYLISKANLAKSPIGGTFELTPLCNMDCEMCFVRLSESEMRRTGRLLTAEEWLRIACEMKEEGTLFLLLTGGEPLLYPEFTKLYRELSQMGFAITLNTNGTLISEDIANLFRQYPPRRVNVTLYGTGNETYAGLCRHPKGWDHAVRGIRLLRQYGIDVKLNGSLVRKNYDELDGLYETAEKLGVPIHVDAYMYPASGDRAQNCTDVRISPEQLAEAQLKIARREMGEEWFRNYIKEMMRCTGENYVEKPGSNQMTCRAGKSAFYITWKGQMQACIFLTGTAADVLKYGFTECWRQIVKEAQEITFSPECGKCVNKNVCNICPASACRETGNYHGIPSYLCRCSEHTVNLIREYYSEEKQTEE